MSAPGVWLESLFGLGGQTAVVIGGTGVLCGAQAQGLARAGARVVLAGRSPEKGAERVAAIEAEGGRASFIAVDVSDRTSVQALCDEVVERHGRVDMLINGAGVNHASEYLELADEDWERVLRANLDGLHYGCQVFGRHMVEAGGGSILNLGSVSAHLPLSRVFAYSASKAAVLNLSQNIAREFAPHGVRVNVLCPGFFPAEQNRKILAPERVEKILAQTPMARFGEPDELVAATILMLSARANTFMTGAAVYVDGGFTAMRI